MTRNQALGLDTAARSGFWAVIILIALFLVSPIAIVVPMSFSSGRYLEFPPPGWSLQWYRAFFANIDWTSSVWVSVQVASLATTFSMLLGVPAAFALVRGTLPSKPLILLVISLPLVFPVVASAVAVYYVFSSLHLVGTKLGLALAHTILALPVVVFPIVAALQRFDYRLEWQAMSLGASRWRALSTVTFPLLRPALLIVMLFAFVTSFDEVVFAIFLSAGDTVTLPKKIWEGLRFEIQPTVTVVATFLIVISSVVLALIALFERRASLILASHGRNAGWKTVG